MKKRSPRPNEDMGFLVPCPVCEVPRNSVCMVRARTNPLTGEPIPAHPAGEMHVTRIALGQKWWDWHKGITHT